MISELVSLLGLTVPSEVLYLAIHLEREGFLLTADGDRLRVGRRDGTPMSPELLCEEDVAAIRRWKTHLLAVIGSYTISGGV